MKSIRLFTLVAILMVFSCSRNSTIPVIDSAGNYPEFEVKLQDIADIRFLKLGGEDEGFTLSGASFGRRLFIDETNKYIVVGEANSNVPKIGLFDLDGNFIRRIGQAGNGPGEYQKSFYFCVIPEKQRIIVYDRWASKFISYDYEGNYISGESHRTDLSFFASVEALGDKVLCYNNHSSYYNWREDKLEETGKVLTLFDLDTFEEEGLDDLKFGQPYNAEVIIPDFLTSTKEGVLLSAPQCDTVWRFGRDLSLAPKFIWKSHNDQQTVICPNIETEDYIFCSTETNNPDYAGEIRYYALRKSDNAVFVIPEREKGAYGIKDFLKGGLRFNSLTRTQNYDYCCKCVGYGVLPELYDLLPDYAKRLADSMTEDSNQMLMLVKFR